jgi:hypothetical protein
MTNWTLRDLVAVILLVQTTVSTNITLVPSLACITRSPYILTTNAYTNYKMRSSINEILRNRQKSCSVTN